MLVRMLAMECALDDWFHRMSAREQKAYLAAHPRSKYATRAPARRSTTDAKPIPTRTARVPARPTGTVTVAESARPVWKKHFSDDAQEYHDAITRGLAHRTASRVTHRGSGSVAVHTEGHDAEGNRTFQADRHFEPQRDGSMRVTHHHFEVDDAHQGHHLGKRFLHNSVRQYRRMRVTHVDTHANLDVGGYAWARYGFHPRDEDAWHDLRDQAHEHYQRVKRHVPTTTRRHVEKLLQSEDPKTAWDLADLSEPVKAPNVNGQHVTRSLGKHLLMDTDWRGHLPLNDQHAMERFNAYVTPRPVPRG